MPMDLQEEKKNWPAGPWLDEPDELRFIDKASGYQCTVWRSLPGGYLCGYVMVEPSHPCYGATAESVLKLPKAKASKGPCGEVVERFNAGADKNGRLGINYLLEIHGGITLATKASSRLSGKDDDLWVFGFDCAHLHDLSPSGANPDLGIQGWSAVYRDFEYVTEQTLSLAQQVKELADLGVELEKKVEKEVPKSQGLGR